MPDAMSDDSEGNFQLAQPVLSKRLRYLNYTINQFWNRWQKEYLLELREAHRYYKGNTNTTLPKVGDIVVIEDKDKPRGMWRLARIDSLIIGNDGYPRGVVLCVSASNGRTSTLQRPLQRMYPLEVTTPFSQAESSTELVFPQPQPLSVMPHQTAASESTVLDPHRVRPRQAAAANARDQLKAIALFEDDSDSEL